MRSPPHFPIALSNTSGIRALPDAWREISDRLGRGRRPILSHCRAKYPTAPTGAPDSAAQSSRYGSVGGAFRTIHVGVCSPNNGEIFRIFEHRGHREHSRGTGPRSRSTPDRASGCPWPQDARPRVRLVPNLRRTSRGSAGWAGIPPPPVIPPCGSATISRCRREPPGSAWRGACLKEWVGGRASLRNRGAQPPQ